MTAPSAALVKNALRTGALGSYVMAAGWGVVLLALALALMTGHGHLVPDFIGSFATLGFLGAVLWIGGSVAQALGWLALRLVRGGHARVLALLAMVLAAAYLIVPLLAIWGLPFMWLPIAITLCAWHIAAATWFWRVAARRAAIGHGVTGGALALAILGGQLGHAGLLIGGLIAASAGAVGGYLLGARYMNEARPFVDLVGAFE